MINLDVASTAYYQSGSLIELAVKILGLYSVGRIWRIFFLFLDIALKVAIELNMSIESWISFI